MATFLDSSLDALNRGYQQLYGRREPSMQPIQPIPVYQAPVVASPNAGRILPMPTNPEAVTYNPVRDVNSPYYPVPLVPAPVSSNPEVGQPLGAGGDTSGAGLLSGTSGNWLQTFLQNLFGGGQSQGQPASLNANATMPLYSAIPANSTAGVGAYGTVGDFGTPAASAGAAGDLGTAPASGGGGPNIGGSILSGIGSGLSQAGKSTASAQTTFTPVNLPLPARAVFAPPNLSPNQKASF